MSDNTVEVIHDATFLATMAGAGWLIWKLAKLISGKST